MSSDSSAPSASKSHSCEHGGGQVKIIASIEEPAVIGRMEHLQRSAAASLAGAAGTAPRGPPDLPA